MIDEYSFSDRVFDKGRHEGKLEAERQLYQKLINKGYTIFQIAELYDGSADEVMRVLHSHNESAYA